MQLFTFFLKQYQVIEIKYVAHFIVYELYFLCGTLWYSNNPVDKSAVVDPISACWRKINNQVWSSDFNNGPTFTTFFYWTQPQLWFHSVFEFTLRLMSQVIPELRKEELWPLLQPTTRGQWRQLVSFLGESTSSSLIRNVPMFFSPCIVSCESHTCLCESELLGFSSHCYS